jgi:hypothetical protein
VEEDEAGKLRAFRAKFGRGWDAEAVEYTDGAEVEEEDQSKDRVDRSGEESLLDLISGYGQLEASKGNANANVKTAKEAAKSEKSK